MRRVTVQLKLSFLDLPLPELYLWEKWDDERKTIVIEALARLIAKATLASNNQPQEENHD